MSETEQTAARQTRTVGTGDDLITYDVIEGDGSAGAAPLMLMGSPMDAGGFGTLAGHFGDRTVLTYDPRGAGRNPTGTGPLTPEQHAEDLHRVISDAGLGPVDLFASSGGAVNSLVLAARHPDDVRRVVAHEPPMVDGLPDAEALADGCRQIAETYSREGHGRAMARFIALVMYDGEVTEEFVAAPAPDPAMFGMSDTDDGDRQDPLMRNLPACNLLRPDYEALAALGDRMVLAVGADSGENLAARGARQVAARLGHDATVLPGDHTGFLGGEFGQTGVPDEFAAALRRTLDS